jgi:hypothetical protein
MRSLARIPLVHPLHGLSPTQQLLWQPDAEILENHIHAPGGRPGSNLLAIFSFINPLQKFLEHRIGDYQYRFKSSLPKRTYETLINTIGPSAAEEMDTIIKYANSHMYSDHSNADYHLYAIGADFQQRLSCRDTMIHLRRSSQKIQEMNNKTARS